MSQPPTHQPADDGRPRRTAAQTALLALGALLLVGGAVCLVLGFGTFAGSVDDPTASPGGALALFAGGGLAMVVGLGVVAFTRVSMLREGAGGAYSRVVIEQGYGPGRDRTVLGGRYCPSCGTPASTGARFCESCGTALA
jgi:hypothetical protein